MLSNNSIVSRSPLSPWLYNVCVVSGVKTQFLSVSSPDLSSNRFDRVPKELLDFKALVKLNCHDNSIRWLLEELFLLPNLKEIDLR